ncbi:hypothetical protein VM1G_11705 [Cytospora mali]|uniref:Uncharacterized protein n=1 Tax=Cytospora mali TaxID=578113 RepID=A0A194W2Y9_CYTMA|nr:hypothetical protein VM1G_11705 [Valsa mali]
MAEYISCLSPTQNAAPLTYGSYEAVLERCLAAKAKIAFKRILQVPARGGTTVSKDWFWSQTSSYSRERRQCFWT